MYQRPDTDLFEFEDHWLLRMDVPGVAEEGVEIDYTNGMLDVTARRNAEGSPHYQRVVNLPRGIDVDRVSAKLADGVLAIEVPKPSSMRPRKIAVTAA